MRLRNLKNRENIINECEFLIKNPENYRGDFKSLFSNNNPIHLEVGMGKGTFIYNMAKTFPEINFIGVEKYENVLARAISKIEECPSNLKIINYDAINLDKIFDKEIDTLYLNFSDPWPKKRHERRRLTSIDFLKIYDKIFKSEKKIIQKTDNIDLFAYSLKSLNNYGYIFEEVCLDLHNRDIFNIKTEYEEKFSNLGFKINYLKATKK